MADNCSTCTAWNAGKDVTIGRCKAHPPAIVLGLNLGQPGSGVPEPQYLFPTTTAGDWCREHEAVAPPPAADSPPAVRTAAAPAKPAKPHPGVMTSR